MIENRDAQAYADNPGAAVTTHPIAQPVMGAS